MQKNGKKERRKGENIQEEETGMQQKNGENWFEKGDREEIPWTIKLGWTELDTAFALQGSVTATYTLFKLENPLLLVVRWGSLVAKTQFDPIMESNPENTTEHQQKNLWVHEETRLVQLNWI